MLGSSAPPLYALPSVSAGATAPCLDIKRKDREHKRNGKLHEPSIAPGYFCVSSRRMTWSIIARDNASGAFGVAIATRFFAAGARSSSPEGLPVELPEHAAYLRLLTRGAEEPSAQEQAANPRSASARLRAAERTRSTKGQHR